MNTEHKKPSRLKDFPYRGQYRYFITLRSHDFKHRFVRRDIVFTAIQFLEDVAKQTSFTIWAYCFMPDHLHLLVEGKSAGADMRRFVTLFKQKTGYWFSRTYSSKLWAPNYYEHVLRNEEDTPAVARYIFRNPVRQGLVDDYASYPYSGSLELEDIRDL